MTRTILVTGGAGYIGSHTVRAMRAEGRPVVVLDSLVNGDPNAVIDAPLVVGDIADEALVTSICTEHDVDTIVHFAAHKAVGESMEQPSKYFHNNVDGSVHLLDAAVAAGVRQFVFSSSCSVVGNPARMPVDESLPIAPESVYAETKAMVEKILGWYDVVHGVRSISLRYFNAAGASFDSRIGERWDQSQNLIPLAIKALLMDEPRLKVFGDDYPTDDGTCIRDYIHVDDLAAAHLAAVDRLRDGGTTTAINVGTGIGSSVKQVLDGIERIAGRPVPHDVVGRRAGDPVATYADPTRSRELLGWTPRYGLDEILDSAFRWHSTQYAAQAGH